MLRKIFLLLFITSCASQGNFNEIPKDSQYQTGRFPLTLNVENIIFENKYKPSLSYPGVEHLLPLPLPLVLKNWVRENIIITNKGNKSLKIVIEEAKATEYDSNSDKYPDLKPNEVLYELILDAKFIVVDNQKNQSLEEISFKIEETGTIEKNKSYHLHNDLFNQLLNKIEKELDQQVVGYINKYLKNILTTE